LSTNRSSRARAEPKGSALLFAALGDKTRLRLVSRLCDAGPLSITKLTAGSNVTRQAITKHLRVMEDAGLVRSTRHGRESIWQLERRRLEDAGHYLHLISKQWDDALGRLRELVEDSQEEGRAHRSHRKARVGSGLQLGKGGKDEQGYG
jgi:DNA-binding transcriptional ArsR family regulator